MAYRKQQPKKAQLWTLVGILAMVIMAMVMLDKCSHTHDAPFARPYVKAGGDTIDVAIEMNPTIYSVKGDSAYGRDYELLMRIAQERGVNFKLHPFVPLQHAMDYLDSGLYDVLVASLPATARMKERFLMTDPVYLDREILVQLVDSASGKGAIASQIQLAHDTVWTTPDSPFSKRIANLSQEIGDTIYVRSAPEYTAEHLFLLVAKGKIKLAVVNEAIARSMHDQYPQVDISTPVSFTQFQSWAVNKANQPLLDSLNIWLQSVDR